MTAIHRREMLGVMLGGAIVATVGSMIPLPAESAPRCPAGPVPRGVRRRKVCWWGRRRRILLLALAHAAWLGQAFAHCPLRVRLAEKNSSRTKSFHQCMLRRAGAPLRAPAKGACFHPIAHRDIACRPLEQYADPRFRLEVIHWIFLDDWHAGFE